MTLMETAMDEEIEALGCERTASGCESDAQEDEAAASDTDDA